MTIEQTPYQPNDNSAGDFEQQPETNSADVDFRDERYANDILGREHLAEITFAQKELTISREALENYRRLPAGDQDPLQLALLEDQYAQAVERERQLNSPPTTQQ